MRSQWILYHSHDFIILLPVKHHFIRYQILKFHLEGKYIDVIQLELQAWYVRSNFTCSHSAVVPTKSRKPYGMFAVVFEWSLFRLDQMFSDAFSHEHQLIKADPKHSLYLACALMVRGNVQVSDIRRNIERYVFKTVTDITSNQTIDWLFCCNCHNIQMLFVHVFHGPTFPHKYCRLKPSLHFIHWNQEGWKTGLCSVPPVGHPYSLLTLANNTCVRHSFTDLRDRFNKLYKRKVSEYLNFKQKIHNLKHSVIELRRLVSNSSFQIKVYWLQRKRFVSSRSTIVFLTIHVQKS